MSFGEICVFICVQNGQSHSTANVSSFSPQARLARLLSGALADSFQHCSRKETFLIDSSAGSTTSAYPSSAAQEMTRPIKGRRNNSIYPTSSHAAKAAATPRSSLSATRFTITRAIRTHNTETVAVSESSPSTTSAPTWTARRLNTPRATSPYQL
jgi:hypothetical protein